MGWFGRVPLLAAVFLLRMVQVLSLLEGSSDACAGRGSRSFANLVLRRGCAVVVVVVGSVVVVHVVVVGGSSSSSSSSSGHDGVCVCVCVFVFVLDVRGREMDERDQLVCG